MADLTGIPVTKTVSFLQQNQTPDTIPGQLTMYVDVAGNVHVKNGAGVDTVLGASSGGSVTSVAMTGDGTIFNTTVPGSPITTAGTLAPALLAQAKNTFLLGPATGGNAVPTWRIPTPADIAPAIAQPAITQAYYVAAQGSDVTGDGSVTNPFATIAHALSVAPTNPGLQPNGLQTRVGIFVGPGSFQEPSLAIKPWVDIIGAGFDATYIRVLDGAGSVTADASWASATGARSGMYNCYLGHGTSVNINLFSIGPNTGTPSAVFTFDKVWVTGTFAYMGRTPGIDYIQGYDSLIFGAATIDATLAACVDWQFESTAALTSTNGPSNSNYIGCVFTGAVTIGTTGSYTNVEAITTSTLFSTLAATGNTTLTADNVSIPVASKLTVTAPATLTRLTDVTGLAFTPTTPANWPTVPTTAQQALDDLATTTAATAPQYAYVNFINGNDSTGNGTQTRPWKTLQHMYNSISPSINAPYTVYVNGGNNDTDTGTITAKPNVNLIGTEPGIQISVPVTITGGTSNDTASFVNFTFIGALNWVRNDATSISLNLFNCEFFTTTTFEQNGSGTASLNSSNSLFVGLTARLANGGYGYFNECTMYGTWTFNDPGNATTYYEFLSGYTDAKMTFTGGPIAYMAGIAVDVANGAAITGATGASGSPTFQTDSASVPAALSGTYTLSLTSNANHEAYTPATPGNWSPAPTQVAGALDQLAARASGGLPLLQQTFTGAAATHNVTIAESGTNYVLEGAAGNNLTIALPNVATATVPYQWTFTQLSGNDGPTSGCTLTITFPAGAVFQTAGAPYTTNYVSVQKGASVTVQNLINTGVFMVTVQTGTWTGT